MLSMAHKGKDVAGVEELGKILDVAMAHIPSGSFAEGDHIGNNGLIVCGKCGTPKQCRVESPFHEEPMIVRCMCACEEREEAERAARAQAEQAAAWADAMRDECFESADFLRTCTFEADDRANPQVSTACERYADTFSQNDRYGLILHGGVGTGKSFMAAAIANRVIDHGFTALQTDIGSIATAMESSFEKRKATLKRILGYDLLVIDDIGAQRSTEYMMQHVYSVIDGRYRQGRPMVITTNLDFEGLSGGLASGPWGRIFDRISEVCYPVEFAGKSRRRVKSVEMSKAMRSRLGL